MKTILVTYSDHTMTKSKELCCSSASKHGCDVFYAHNPDTIAQDFKYINQDIFSQSRGAGYWLWKSYVIYKAMIQPSTKEGDIIVYSDAGIEFVNSVRHIIDRMDEDIFFFTNGFPHVEWCKVDVLSAILPGHPDHQLTALDDFGVQPKQVQASVIFFRVNQQTKDFVKEWLLYCQMPGFIDDSPSKLPNYPTFAEHRHDQAICTCLAIKHGYKLHFWPTNYSEHIRHTAQPEDSYPTLFNHHRKRNHEWD